MNLILNTFNPSFYVFISYFSGGIYDKLLRIRENPRNDRYLNIRSLNFDKTVKDYSDSLNAMVYRQSPEEEECLMGTGVTLYLTLDKNKVPAAPVQQITID